MSDFFTFRDSLEPEGSTHLPKQRGGGADAQQERDLSNFDVEATDGRLGKVLDATYAAGESYLVVNTGGTILSKRVVLPAGVIDRIDEDAKRIYLDRSKEEIKNAPEFDEERFREESYRQELTEHYTR